MSTAFLSSACTSLPRADYSSSPQQREGNFRNTEPRREAAGLAKTLQIAWRFMFDKPADTVPDRALDVLPLSQSELLAAPDLSLWRLGHSTLLLKLEGRFWLTDPVFSLRASPFQWMGPKRFHAPPIALDQLPPIAGVILSHDHYDHLDEAAVKALAPKVELFVTPLGVGDRLIAWGIPAAKVRQLDWWQATEHQGLRLVCTPAQHFSGRSLSDGNQTLWASWALLGQQARVFFSGDSGYFDGFREIGERLGPFDLSLMETGAYDPQWPDVHMQPAQSLQAHLDVKARVMLPIHNGTFDLAMHGWTDPFEQISALAEKQGVPLSMPRIGERVALQAAKGGSAWWR
ncbi:MBL fold metallo-hydrolase [Pelomonas sp. SE-A7]|uniref:MBL fold metallo-hydrolase n=1 Tax=Pelomonas sp. SE-A7 TaxID=3054953 RepID=UPI00259D229C|nr:MBL fold metallo-hydrolase [Pelomonas sp. SE-A7]MDM4767762.1 MBL fold metallo-hydrolase [Pelomonas sp. SE-A7]